MHRGGGRNLNPQSPLLVDAVVALHVREIMLGKRNYPLRRYRRRIAAADLALAFSWVHLARGTVCGRPGSETTRRSVPLQRLSSDSPRHSSGGDQRTPHVSSREESTWEKFLPIVHESTRVIRAPGNRNEATQRVLASDRRLWTKKTLSSPSLANSVSTDGQIPVRISYVAYKRRKVAVARDLQHGDEEPRVSTAC